MLSGTVDSGHDYGDRARGDCEFAYKCRDVGEHAHNCCEYTM